MMEISRRLQALQKTMREDGVEAWLLFTSDPHLSEYLPDYWKLREYFSGFTGSAGTLMVLKERAYLWTDSRYWVQAEKELEGTGIVLQKQGLANTLSYTELLLQTLPQGSRVALLGETISVELFYQLEESLEEGEIELITHLNPFHTLWEHRPSLPLVPIYRHKDEFVAKNRVEKLSYLREVMAKEGAKYHLLSTLDDMAWLLNLRGSDVMYNPVFLSYFLLEETHATLFIDEARVVEEIIHQLATDNITIKPYAEVYQRLACLKDDEVIMLDPARTNFALLEAVPENVEVAFHFNPSTLAKACKSEEEVAHIRKAMAYDGAAMCEFFVEFEARLNQGETLTELTVAEILEEKRRQKPHYVSLSFGTIAGFKANGALPHYSATSESYAVIEGDGLLLIDSGAQYHGGTTDITRVIPIGEITTKQKRDFTFVLKSHIQMSLAHFPQGIKMGQLDAIARAPLWRHHMDYGHGTGHGVGYFMNVHEGPHVLSYNAKPIPEATVKKGMITSIEPGLYRKGEWGIRIENLVVVVEPTVKEEEQFGRFLAFETLTLCPIDTRLIEPSLLLEEEKNWLNRYHQKVCQDILPLLSEKKTQDWLITVTASLQ